MAIGKKLRSNRKIDILNKAVGDFLAEAVKKRLANRKMLLYNRPNELIREGKPMRLLRNKTERLPICDSLLIFVSF